MDAPTTRKSISDGAHVGNAHFFFLPPLLSSPQYTGEADGSQAPTVVVCEWKTDAAGRGSCGDIVAQFARTGGTTDKDITYDESTGIYQVNWHTDQCSSGPCTLDPAKTYRLRVILGAFEIGYADLDVVSSGKELKNVQTGDYIGLVDGRTLPIKFRIEKGAVSVAAVGTPTNVGADGGNIATNDGMVALEIPAGALSSVKPITVTTVTRELPGIGAWSAPVDLGPDRTTFAQPVTLTLGFDASKLPPGVTAANMALYVWAGDSWLELPGSVVNETDNTVSAPISHFSLYYVTVRPNTISGIPTVTTIWENEPTIFSGAAVEVVSEPATYCSVVRTPVVFILGTAWIYQTRCYTTTVTNYYPTAGRRLNWTAVNLDFTRPALAVRVGDPGYSVTGADGTADSPQLWGIAPGQALVEAELARCSRFGTGTDCVEWEANESLWGVQITVLRRAVASVALTPPNANLTTSAPGNTQQLTATVYDNSNSVLSGRTVTWSSSDETVAKVDAAGMVTGVGGGTATITATSEGKSGTAAVTVQAAGITIAFSSGNATTGERLLIVAQVRPDGTDERYLARYPLSAGGLLPRWSRDGTRIVYYVGDDQNSQVYVIDANTLGAQPVQLTNSPGANVAPSFSPVDGNRIVLTSMRGGGRDLWLLDINTNVFTQLTHNPSGQGYASFSPDGKQIAFARAGARGQEIWVLDVQADANNDHHERQITDIGGYCAYPRWSPTSDRLLFERDGAMYIASTQLTAPASLADLQTVSSGGLQVDSPDWSFDGKKILFTAAGIWDLYTINLDGTGLAKVVTPGGEQENYASFKPGP